MENMRYTKKDGPILWQKGFGLIDTSGRTRDLQEKSSIALASKTVQYSVLYKAKTKKEIFELYKENYPKENLIVLNHCCGIYYCLKDNIENMPGAFICADGLAQGKIKHYLQQMLQDKYNPEKIIILSSLKKIFGKKNQADRLAYSVNKGKQKPTLQLERSHIEKFLKKK